ncbi:hypothetical protein A0H81_10443 [Grifola frondosa]|uniref:Uncharacterized protein n=1 Tax=Grifola frondosa TaxID=5627 RepID=A0A1C7LZL2_GRIFR|nr:hypothetical protein A0H81_10443 [Grifola frondosa]
MLLDKATLDLLPRKELQAIAKRENIAANAKKELIIDRLLSTYPDGVPPLDTQALRKHKKGGNPASAGKKPARPRPSKLSKQNLEECAQREDPATQCHEVAGRSRGRRGECSRPQHTPVKKAVTGPPPAREEQIAGPSEVIREVSNTNAQPEPVAGPSRLREPLEERVISAPPPAQEEDHVASPSGTVDYSAGPSDPRATATARRAHSRPTYKETRKYLRELTEFANEGVELQHQVRELNLLLANIRSMTESARAEVEAVQRKRLALEGMYFKQTKNRSEWWNKNEAEDGEEVDRSGLLMGAEGEHGGQGRADGEEGREDGAHDYRPRVNRKRRRNLSDSDSEMVPRRVKALRAA